jgi:hypothetical protein
MATIRKLDLLLLFCNRYHGTGKTSEALAEGARIRKPSARIIHLIGRPLAIGEVTVAFALEPSAPVSSRVARLVRTELARR